MDPRAYPAPHRVVLWGIVAPLLVGATVPELGGVALLWLVVGMATFVVSGLSRAVRAADPGDDDVVPAVVPDRGPRRRTHTLEDPNVAAARAGSWG